MKIIHHRARRAWATALLAAAFGASATASASAAPAPVSSLTASSCPAVIKAGQASGCVTRLQNLLNAKSGARLPVTGYYGPATTEAVRKWQRSHRITVDGAVGLQTKRSLDPAPVQARAAVRANAPVSRQAAVVNAVTNAMNSKRYPYVWGGGHGAVPGPTAGGLDCSGFTRWMFARGYGYDILGPGSAASQAWRGSLTSSPQAGDLVLFSSGGVGAAHHAAVYLGGGRIAEAAHPGTVMRYSTVKGSTAPGVRVYYVRIR